MNYSGFKVTHSYSKVTYSYPKVTYSYPRVTYSDPKMTLYTSTYLQLPHLASVWPLVRCNETCGWVGGGGWVTTNFNVSS